MSPPKEHVSGFVPQHQRRQIEAIAGDRGFSAGLRDVISAGLLALQSDAALLRPVDELVQLADKLATIQGRRTPSGAWWAADGNRSMPAPHLLDSSGDVVSSPGRVVLAGDGALQIDLSRGVIEAQRGDEVAQQPVELQTMVAIAALLPASLVGLAQAIAGGSRQLGAGLVLHRLADGSCRLSLHHVPVACSVRAMWLLSAELQAAVVAAINSSVDLRQQLEAQLEASHG